MKLLVGLGNPGEKYEKTRHNLGFVVLDHLLKKIENLNNSFWDEEKKIKSQTKKVDIKGSTVLLIKPLTFMNESGNAVAAASSYYKIEPKDIIIIHDDLDLPLGKIRVRFGGGHGGHKGVESVIKHLNTDKFLRVRLGIGHPHHHEGKLKEGKSHIAVEDYVLSIFSPSDKGKVKTMTSQVVKIVDQIMAHGIDLYLSKFNPSK